MDTKLIKIEWKEPDGEWEEITVEEALQRSWNNGSKSGQESERKRITYEVNTLFNNNSDYNKAVQDVLNLLLALSEPTR